MRRSFTALVLIAALACTGDGYAATQGTLGNTSTGTFNFSVTKPARAQISDINDLLLPGWIAGDGQVNLTDDICVYSTRPSGGYRVTATGSGAGGAFRLANGASLLTYTVIWNSGGVGNLANTGTTLTAGVQSSARSNAATDSPTCNGAVPGPTARLIVRVTAGNMGAAAQGTYTGTLTLLITPI